MIKWLSNIGNLVKVIISMITLGGIILGGIRTYNRFIISHDRKLKSEQSRDTKIDMVLTKLDSLEVGQSELKNIVNDHTDKLDGVMRSQVTLKTIVTREFAKTMTPEQVLQMMNDFEKKNNGTSFYQTLPGREGY